MEEIKKLYLLYGVTNWAETWRDPDEFHYSDFKIFSTFEKMCEYVIPFINDQIDKKYEKEVEKIELDEEGKWHYSIMGSFMPTYVVEEIEANESYLSKKAAIEKENAAMEKWCKNYFKNV